MRRAPTATTHRPARVRAHRVRDRRDIFKSPLESLPNIGRSIAADLRLIGISEPADLVRKDPYELYEKLCQATGAHQDPCVIDTFISAVRYMEGAPERPWWYYTSERKKALAATGGRPGVRAVRRRRRALGPKRSG